METARVENITVRTRKRVRARTRTGTNPSRVESESESGSELSIGVEAGIVESMSFYWTKRMGRGREHEVITLVTNAVR